MEVFQTRTETCWQDRERAVKHADKLTRASSNGEKRHFYGDIYPIERQAEERRVIVKIAPLKVSTDAVFG